MAITTLDTFARSSADPHALTITGATAGRDIILLVHAPAAVTTPAGWVLLDSRVATTGGYAFRLPAANNPGGNINVSLDLSGSRAVAAVALQSDMNFSTFYEGMGTQSSTATAYGAGIHTFTARSHTIAVHMVAANTSGNPTQTPSYSSGFSLLADSGWAGAGAAGNEAVRVYVGHRAASAMTSEGAVLTVGSTTGVSNEFSGVLAWDALAPVEPAPAEFGADIVAENALAGHNKSNFTFLTGQWTRPGYADGFTYNVGATVPFKVDSPESFTLEIFRLGYYGGAGARRVATVNGTAFTQPAATVNATTLEADAANWTTNASWAIPASAVSGVYVALVRGATAGNFWRMPFVVRDDAHVADVIVKTSDTTWQAYNSWGGRDLYGDTAGFNDAARSSAVRYDRPSNNEYLRPQTSWENSEWSLIQWLERNGYNVKYVSSVDVDRDPTLILGARVVISSGHDEYWSQGIWDAFVAARAAGVNTIFMTGNEAFWRVRFTDNRRRMVCYKDTKAGSQIDPVSPTGTWQDTRSFNTAVRRAPASLTGSRFIANGIREDTLRVPQAYSGSPLWRNTSVATLSAGQERTYPGLLGFEWNGYFPTEGEIPASHLTMSSTSIALTNQMADVNGNAYNLTGTPEHRIILMQDPASNALTLGLGTNQWAWGLGAERNRGISYGVYADIKQATYNILRDMGVAPATPESGIVVSAPQAYPFAGAAQPPVLRVFTTSGWLNLTGPNAGTIASV